MRKTNTRVILKSRIRIVGQPRDLSSVVGNTGIGRISNDTLGGLDERRDKSVILFVYSIENVQCVFHNSISKNQD